MIEGKVWKLGHNIDTDVIIPGKYLNIQDPMLLSEHCFEGIEFGFVKRISPGDMIIAGRNFGCGSSREHAPIAIKASGIVAVVAISFARIFYRNSINIGLPIFESKELYDDVEEGNIIRIDDLNGVIINLATGKKSDFIKFPEFIQEIIQCGGLINYGKRKISGINP